LLSLIAGPEGMIAAKSSEASTSYWALLIFGKAPLDDAEKVLILSLFRRWF
jgi:hypothetical protein